MTSLPIALQLYTVRDEAARDFTGMLRQVAALGYTSVEFAGYGNLGAAELRVLLNELGLRAPAAHNLKLDMSVAEQEHALAYAKELGCEYAIIPWLGLPRLTETPFATLVHEITALGQRCQEAGLQLAYHNHDYAFKPQADGRLVLEDLLAAVSPSLLTLELDIYWAAYAGVDPIAYLREHNGRVALLHLKDMGPEREMLEVGDGTLDMAAIIATGQDVGVRWLVVEHDQPVLPSLESARRSLENLQTRI